MHRTMGTHALVACSLLLSIALSETTEQVIRLKIHPEAPVDSIQYTTSLLTPEELSDVTPFYDDLPLDPYLETVSRTRRFGKYMLDSIGGATKPIQLSYKGNVFVQTGMYNDLVRNGKMAMVRQYEEHKPGFFESPTVQKLLEHYLESMKSMGAPLDVAFELGIHAVRLTAPGEVTPEGTHRDGYHYVLSTVMAKEGIVGGHSLVHTHKTTKPLLDVPMQPGDSLLINDREIYHSVSNITLSPGHTFGHRDVILITARPWPTNAAGELVDDVANAQLALLEGVVEDPEPGHEGRLALRSWGERLGKLGRFLTGA